ncbi:unnamed protein product [Closterium sp. Naga37s-1]|nr:unnamed protein product [Closterium sp. Naga37s-1]
MSSTPTLILWGSHPLPRPLRPLTPPLIPPYILTPPPVQPRGATVMTGKRPRQGRASGYSAVPSPPEARDELAPVLLRAAVALVAHEGAGAPSRPRELVYRSPCGRTHSHLRARGGSFHRRRPPRPTPALQRQIVGPHLQAPSPLPPPPPPPQPPPSSSQQSSQQQSSGPPTSSPVVASPALTSAPVTVAGSPPPPLPVPPQPVLPAGAHLVPLLPDQARVDADLLSEPPQRRHPLVPLDPSPVARFPPHGPRAESPPLPPDALDPEDDEKWWNDELWESPPMSGTTWGRDWDMKSDFVLDVLRWERRMIGVGECLSHVATALEQLHAGLEARNSVLRDPQLTEQQQGVVRDAAAQGLWRLLRLPLESEHPDENEGLGAGAFRRVAMAAEQAPLQLVPALASLLRWIRRRFYVLNHV